MWPELKSYLGPEYPAAVTRGDVRMPLVSEKRWMRFYATKDRTQSHEVSRFLDGSAAITYPELAREWAGWSKAERRDFYSACSWLQRQADFADMLRHILRNGDADDWFGLAGLAGVCLPRDEAFELLCGALDSTKLEMSSNIAQGISLTEHPGVESVLRLHLAALRAHPGFENDDGFCNRLAEGAIHCISLLIKAGAPAGDFAEEVRVLSAHPCKGNRDSCRGLLVPFYPWLKE